MKSATVKELLHPPREKTTEDISDKEHEPHDARKGEVFEDTNHYYILGKGSEPVIISSFQIEPCRRIIVENGEIIDADVYTDRGRLYRNVRFPREAWHSKRNLLKVLGPVDLQWSGSDENVQGVLRLIASREVPTLKGTTNLGYLETDKGPRWVTPGCVLAPAGDVSEEDIIYVSSGATLCDRVCYKPNPAPLVETAAAAAILPRLLELNTPEVVLPILGWFFAAPLKPRITKLLRHFPILMVWGTQGSGKSTTIMEVFWPMFGVVAADPYSATETEFALIKLLSSTNSVPIFIDEYKPHTMQRFRKNTLHRYIRRLYGGEVEERGRADQTLVTYRLSAPLCLAGESRPTESAVVERIIVSNPEKNKLESTPRYEHAYHAIQQTNPTLIASSIIRFLLSCDTEADMSVAKSITDKLLKNREVPFRVRDNLVVMVLGLHCFEEFAASLDIALPDLQVDLAVDKMLKDILEGGGVSVKSALDYFLEELSVMAIAGTLQHGRHYIYDNGFLALSFGACHAAYCEHARRTALEGDVPDRKAMRRMVVECYEQDGYVKETDALVCFNGRGDRRRAVLIDIEAAKSRLNVDDFPVPEPEVTTGYRRWETD